MCAPDPPDYRGAAQEQAASSKEVTAQQNWANRPTQNTPWGSTNWTTAVDYDPGTGQPVTKWTQNETLNPQLQTALNDQINIQAGRSAGANTLLGQANAAMQSPLNFGAAPMAGTFGNVGYAGPDYWTKRDPGQIADRGYAPGTIEDQNYQKGSVNNAETARNRAEAALYARQIGMIEPGLTQSEGARRTRMANMGISPEGGSEAWRRAQEGMDTTRNRAYGDAALNAVIGGGAEATREQGMDIAKGGFDLSQAQGAQGLDIAREQTNLGLAQGAQGLDIARAQTNMGLEQGRLSEEQARLGLASGFTDTLNRQRQQDLAEQQLRQTDPLNRLNALLTGQQVASPQMPSFSQASAAQPTQYLAAAQAQGQNASQGTDWGSLLGTAAKVGGAYMTGGASLMSDRRLKKNIVPLNHGWYAFSYLWDNALHFGVMAQEVLAWKPQAVALHPSGYLMVDYSQI